MVGANIGDKNIIGLHRHNKNTKEIRGKVKKMKHLIALLIKFIMVLAVLEVVLSLMTELDFVQILMMSVTVTILAYLIGDLLILSVSNNIVATIADAALVFVLLYFYNYFYPGNITYSEAVAGAVVLAVGEWFFHKYMAASVLPSHRHRPSH